MFTDDELFTAAKARKLILVSMEKASKTLLDEIPVSELDNRMDWFDRYSTIIQRFSEAMKNCELPY